jgi:serine/threonine-protein kinase
VQTDPGLISVSLDAFPAPTPDPSAGAPARGIFQGRAGSRPDVAPLLRRRLMIVAAIAVGAGIGSLLINAIAFTGVPLLEEIHLQTKRLLNGPSLALNLGLLALLGLWRRASESSLRVLDLTLFLLNFGLLVEVPFLMLGPEHANADAVAAILLIRCIFIPDTPLRTLLFGLGLWLLYGLGFLASVRLFAGQPPQLMSADLVWPHFVGSHFIIGLNLAIGMVAVHTIHGLRLRAFRAERAGSYQLMEKLGEGGMGEVWRARHALLHRPTAVKMLRADLLDSPTALKRFEREVRAVSELTDPNTIAIYDFGKTDGGRFYYAMEFLEGLDLQQLVERYGPVDPARSVFILRQALSSLAEAHSRGILHRDIKPSNVFLTVRGTRFDFVKVLDFGLVKHLEAALDEDAVKLTGDGTLTGSPMYLAPERFYGDDPAGQASDLYSVGAVAYFLLAGHPVFESRTPMQVLVDHVKTAPTPLRQKGLALSEALDRAILKALDKSPERRYQSAEEFLSALRSTPEWDGWTRDQARRWWEQRLPVATLLASQPILPNL